MPAKALARGAAILILLLLSASLAAAQEAEVTPTPTLTPAAAAAVETPAATPAFLTPSPAPALATVSPTPALNLPAGGSGDTLQIVFYLVLLFGLFAGGAWLLRSGFGFRPKMKGERKLHLREMRMLGNRQFLVVAEYEDRKMLLGVCPGRIDYLCTLTGSAEPEFPNIAPEKSEDA